MTELNIIERRTNKCTRYFTVPDRIDGFDGTAQGWGYKTKQALHKAFSYHQNRHKIAANAVEAKQFLGDNPDVVKIIAAYMDEQECLYRAKDGDPTSIPHLIKSIQKEQPDVAEKLRGVKPLYREFLK